MCNRNEIIDRLNEHNSYCERTFVRLLARREGTSSRAKAEEQRAIVTEAVDAMRQGNVEVGIQLCCIAREAGIDACVDMYYGYVIPQSNKNDFCRTFEFYKK